MNQARAPDPGSEPEAPNQLLPYRIATQPDELRRLIQAFASIEE
jgi:hypothetical protein